MTNEYLLGLPFLYDYYLVLNFDNNTIGFNGEMVDLTPVDPSPVDPNPPSPGPEPQPDDPTNQPESPSSFPWWIIIVVLASLFVIGAAVIFFRLRNKRLQRDLGRE
jgi:hypothetical protein